MKDFTYSYPTHVYFGKGALANALKAELPAAAKKVLLAYGGGSIKKNGIYEEVTSLLRTLGKEVVEFTGIMANPTYAKVQEGAKIAKENAVDYILAGGGGHRFRHRRGDERRRCHHQRGRHRQGRYGSGGAPVRRAGPFLHLVRAPDAGALRRL